MANKYRAVEAEPVWAPLIQTGILPDGSSSWENDLYVVRKTTTPYLEGGTQIMFHLNIRRTDRGHLLDWRHKQYIKNQLIGPEEEAVEIYPAESRLIDGANSFHLWGIFGSKVPIGWFEKRDVSEFVGGGRGKQRPFDIPPPDLKQVDGKLIDEIADEYRKTGKMPKDVDEYLRSKVERHVGKDKPVGTAVDDSPDLDR